MKLLKKIPFFLFLLVVFFCLHGSVENYGYVGLKEVVVIGLFILFFTALFFLLVQFFTRDYIFTSLITFFIAGWYLFFGAIKDFLTGIPLLAFLQGYFVIIPLLLILTLCWIIFLKRKKQLHPKLVFYLNLLMIIYCILDVILIVQQEIAQPPAKAASVNFDYNLVKQKPDIYLMVFDEYPGYKSLTDSFGFANDSLYLFLNKKGFNILPVFSNYALTAFSMSSIFNMQYVQPGYDPLRLSQLDFQVRTGEIRHAAVFDIFKDLGYRFNNYSIFDIHDLPGLSNNSRFVPVHSIMLTDKIFHNRFMRNSMWFIKKFPLWSKKYLFEHDVNNQKAQEMIVKSAAGKNEQPVFSYAHFFLPHLPFYRDSTGKYNSIEYIADDAHVHKDRFLSHLKYTNMVITSLVEDISRNDPNAIVIIMSDHGFKNYSNRQLYEPLNFDNICAIRYPGKPLLPFREKWSMVNLFPYVFNSFYNQQLPYLADSSIVLRY